MIVQENLPSLRPRPFDQIHHRIARAKILQQIVLLLGARNHLLVLWTFESASAWGAILGGEGAGWVLMMRRGDRQF